MRAAVLAILFMTTLSLPAAAAGFLYDCDMTGFERAKGWISPKIAIVVRETGSAEVVDAVSLHFAGGAVPATILRDNDARFIVKWSIEGARTDSGMSFANFDYRASIAKASGAIEVSAIPRNFDTGVRSAGTCRIRRQ